jgi:hypothetical protein
MYNVSLVRYNPTTGANDIWYRTGWDSSTPPHLMLYKWGTAAPILDLTELKNDLETKGVTTFQPPNPEVAFIVDPVRGEARFDFPKSDVINQAEIDTMNQNVIGNWGSKTNGPVRRHQIPLGATATYVPRIVPGSEVVRGPDMTPGLPDYMIKMVRYKRVPLALIKPGRNQYTIDYGLGLDSKPGEITFSSLSDEQIPLLVADPPNGTKPGSIEIKYRFQVNHDGDVVVGNYATKTLLTVTLGIRFYDSNSGKVHPVELTNKVRVRNLMR